MSKKKNKKEVLPNFMKLHDLHTRLLEVCDWDEKVAEALIKKSLNVYTDLYEYSQYDAAAIQSEEDFERLFKVNMGEITDNQVEALKDLLDERLKEIFSKC